MFVTLMWAVAVLAVFILVGSAAWAGWRAAPFVPTRQRDVERMLRLSQLKSNELVYDLGAGDGRYIVTAAKKYQARTVGFEISLFPYLIGWWRIWRARQGSRAAMRLQDFFHQDLSDADVVVCFLTPGAMKKLSLKFQHELRPGTRVVSYAFPMQDRVEILKDKPSPGTMAVYVYTI